MRYIDIHCHLDFPDYGNEIGEVLNRMKDLEVGAISIGCDLESSKRAVNIAEANEGVWACIGVHPEIPSPDQGEGRVGFQEKEFENLVQNPKVVAVGECGLDFYRVDPVNLENEKVRQTALFKQQIEFALKHDKPLMLHCRAAYDEVLEILRSYKGVRGNCHFFAGSVEQAKQFLELGFTLSFTGVITFTNDYDEIIKPLPIESIMSETDAPFVAPVPFRGKRNEPAYVVEVVKKLAELKGVSESEMASQILQNAQKMFILKIEN